MRVGRHRWLAVALVLATPAAAQMAQPGTAPAVGPDAPSAEERARDSATNGAQQAGDIISESEFDSALPPLSDDPNAPLEPIAPDAPADQTPPAASPTPAQVVTPGTLPPSAPAPVELTQPLTPLGQFDTQPLQTVADVPSGEDAPQLRYDTVLRGLEDVNLAGRFKELSALEAGDGKATNATQVSARAKEDEALAIRLMKSLGYYDGTAISTLETIPNEQKLRAIVSATPGSIYTLGSITVDAKPTTPPDLVREQLPLKVGDPVEAARIQGAEANVSLILPQRGYPFVKVGDRDVLLDSMTQKGDYTLPVDTGPYASFGQLRTEGDPVFGLDHLNVFPRFDQGEIYDARMTDDLREALVATQLFDTVSVEPVRSGRAGPDGTEQVDLLVRQTKGPSRSLAASAGYGTGEGIKLEGLFTSRNRFPPEGALILNAIAGTQQQGAGATFRRSNAGKRDRTVSAGVSALRQDYDAFNAITGSLFGRISYDSTPIWQKKFTYAYGFELTGSNESVYDFDRLDRVRRTYFIAALPGQVQFDQSDSLLNPTKGYRLKLNVSPETSVQGSVSPYVRARAEATGYYPIGDSFVIAGRALVGTIAGIARDDLAPSRRFYGGGGGSVRGYGYQRLGPFDPNGDPVGGRSINEFALEARYRFGNFGIVPFVDAGNAYESSSPRFNDLRFGAGIGGRFYTNFGPMRVDIATPLNPRPGDGKVALYISIGQAF